MGTSFFSLWERLATGARSFLLLGLIGAVGARRARVLAQVAAAAIAAAFVIGVQVVGILAYGTPSRDTLLRSEWLLTALPERTQFPAGGPPALPSETHRSPEASWWCLAAVWSAARAPFGRSLADASMLYAAAASVAGRLDTRFDQFNSPGSGAFNAKGRTQKKGVDTAPTYYPGLCLKP